MKLRAILTFLLLLPVYLFADLEGTYRFFGTQPDGDEYQGTAVITKTGESYRAIWTFSDGSVEEGTGVVKEDFVAFHFFAPDIPDDSGVILYERHGVVLKGIYAIDGSSETGREKAIKIKNDEDHHHHPHCCNN